MNVGCIRAIERDRAKAGARSDVLFLEYPLQQYNGYLRIIAGRHGVYEGKYAWQECEEASLSAYMYSINRCAAQNYPYVDNYIKKMYRIFIYCAATVASYEMKRASFDDCFERMHNRKLHIR